MHYIVCFQCTIVEYAVLESNGYSFCHGLNFSWTAFLLSLHFYILSWMGFVDLSYLSIQFSHGFDFFMDCIHGLSLWVCMYS